MKSNNLKFSKNKVSCIVFCTLICFSFIFDVSEAKKIGGGRRGGSSSKSVSSGRVQKPQPSINTGNAKYDKSHADQASLSYSGYNQRANPPKASAPVAPAAPIQPAAQPAKPIGWNVDNNAQKQSVSNVNSAPYPNQGQHAAPPAYSQHPQPNQQSSFNQAPPAYSPHNPGYPAQGAPPAYSPHNPGYPAQGAPPAYSQQNPGYPQQSYPQGVPQQGYGGGAGYPNQGYAQGGQYPGQQPVVNNYHLQQPGRSGGGSGLTNALLLGVGGVALYGALKPGGETQTIIYNNTVTEVQVPAAETTATTGSTATTGVTGTTVLNPDGSSTTPAFMPVYCPPILPTNCTENCPPPAPLPVNCIPPPTTMNADGTYSTAPLAPLAPFPGQTTMTGQTPLPGQTPYPGQTTAMGPDGTPLAPLVPLPGQTTTLYDPASGAPIVPLPGQTTSVTEQSSGTPLVPLNTEQTTAHLYTAPLAPFPGQPGPIIEPTPPAPVIMNSRVDSTVEKTSPMPQNLPHINSEKSSGNVIKTTLALLIPLFVILY